MNQPKIEIVRLADLVFMEEGPGIQALATAIERHGIWGWDRFQRFVFLAPPAATGKETSARAQDSSHVLDLLAEESRRQISTGLDVMKAVLRGEPPPELSIEFNWELQPFGWKPDQLPDFPAIQAEQDPQTPAQLPGLRPAQGNGKDTATLLRLIGALLHVLAGDDERRPHPDWHTPGDPQDFSRMVRYLSRQWAGYAGMTERTITGHFKAALEVISKEPGVRPAVARTLRDNE
jgi:hypothetical protein